MLSRNVATIFKIVQFYNVFFCGQNNESVCLSVYLWLRTFLLGGWERHLEAEWPLVSLGGALCGQYARHVLRPALTTLHWQVLTAVHEMQETPADKTHNYNQRVNNMQDAGMIYL